MPESRSITCAQCGIPTSSEGPLPKFCSHCGSRFETIVEGVGSSGSTGQPEAEQTIAGSQTIEQSDSIALDQTHDSSFVIRPATSSTKLGPGDEIGPFRLGCQLGSGGMGTVYEAHDTESDRPVALKLLSKQVRTTSEGVDRFRRESQVAASINHPGSTFVYRSGQYGEQFFIAMELMNGGTLRDIVEDEGPLEVSRAVDFILDTIEGLAVAHDVGIVHRDFKPSNCFLDDDGHAKVGDFGLAKSFYGDVALTQTGAFIGTPQFAAPEQLRAGHVDARTDIYAVGGTLFYLLAGRAPFVGDAAQVIAGIAAEQPPNIKSIAPHVPEKLASLLANMLEKDPARRPASLQEIRQALLPFSSLGAITPDNGQRMAAFFIDMFMFGFVGFVIASVLSSLTIVFDQSLVKRSIVLVNSVAIILWFAVQEYVGGTTIGKWLFHMRVINSNNETPKLWQAIVRPLFIPGARSLVAILPVLLMGTDGSEAKSMADLMRLGLVELVSILAWIPCMLFMLTARATNGYRGLHDLLTDTRVVRISSSLNSKHPKNQPVTAPLPVDPEDFSTATIKPFEILGQMGANSRSGERILIGQDPQLDRKVWIYETTDAVAPLQHAGIRPTRQRVIATRRDASVQPPRDYYITECIEGMPLVAFIESSESLQWTTCRPLLRALADELERSENESSLPKGFSKNHIWVDKSGQLKLVEIAESGSEEASTSRDVFDQVFAMVVEHHPVPEHVIELNEAWHGSKSTTFSEIVDKLDEIENRPSGWSWIDRIGVTSVWLAIELSILTLLGQLWLMLCESWTGISSLWICSSFVVSMSVVAFLIGFVYESPTFWFLGIAARSRNKRLKPSRFQLGLRMFLTWILPLAMAAAIIGIQAEILMSKPGEIPIVVLFLFLLFLAVNVAMLIVTLFNLAKPDRGVADVICGTQLMRK